MDTDAPNFPLLSQNVKDHNFTITYMTLPHILLELCDKQDSRTDGRTRVNL